MTFDAIDKKFRRPEPIKLECVDCGGTEDVKPFHTVDSEESVPLCWTCRLLWIGGM